VSKNIILVRKETVGKEPSFRKDLSPETEEKPLLEAVIRRRLVETVTNWEH
jgi:hypothetical protein